jgi:hypothetical protein
MGVMWEEERWAILTSNLRSKNIPPSARLPVLADAVREVLERAERRAMEQVELFELYNCTCCTSCTILLQEELTKQLARRNIYTDMIRSDLEALVNLCKVKIVVFANGKKYVMMT